MTKINICILNILFSGSKMVDHFFGRYIRKNYFDIIVLCGRRGKKQDCDVITTEEPYYVTRLYTAWNKFFKANHLNQGDTIRFKFATMDVLITG
jgi:hypothetical protein